MPLGLAQQGVRMFMPCRFEGYNDIRNLALHRIQSAQSTSQAFQRPADFDLQAYDDKGRFAFGQGNQLSIHLWLKDELAVLLAESPLAVDQQIKPAPKGQAGCQLKATVTDSSMLVWWLRSQGAGVKVLAPKSLADSL